VGESTTSAFRFAVAAIAKAEVRPNPARRVNDSPSAESSAEELARRCQAGCRESFELLVRRFEAHIFNFLQQLTRNRQDAEDLAQVTFLKAYRNLHQYKPSFAFAPWLFSIARRTAASHFRSAEYFEELPDDGEAIAEDPATLLAAKDEQSRLWRLARTLKPKQWEALWLRYGEGFSVAETARVMGTNSIHVKVLLHRGRAALAKLLAARGMESGMDKDPSGTRVLEK
jgi:RNA polymerase sigma-70 factor, ECF subfamily